MIAFLSSFRQTAGRQQFWDSEIQKIITRGESSHGSASQWRTSSEQKLKSIFEFLRTNINYFFHNFYVIS